MNPSEAMEDYFREGEQKSREEDYVPEAKTSKGIPPPPKAAAPPPRAMASSPEKDVKVEKGD
jgi:hypothetical protein